MTKDRIVKYAGVSLMVDADGSQSAHFHTSNHEKCAVWSLLPEKEHTYTSIVLTWYKMPADCTKHQAIKILMDRHDHSGILWDMLTKQEERCRPKTPKRKRTEEERRDHIRKIGEQFTEAPQSLTNK